MKTKHNLILDYLKRHNLNNKPGRDAFIDGVGIKHIPHLGALLNPQKSGRYPSPELALAIEKFTKREIRAVDIINPRFKKVFDNEIKHLIQQVQDTQVV